MSNKTRVGVIYGGVSGEHEVSLMSALSVCQNLDSDIFEVVPIAIDKQGQWWLNDRTELLSKCERSCFIHGEKSKQLSLSISPTRSEQNLKSICDVVFPVLHGPLYEDGTIQGFFVHADIPYVGCGVLSSAIAMDKHLQKMLLEKESVDVAKSKLLHKQAWVSNSKQYMSAILHDFEFPVFIKPNTLGSSVATEKAKSAPALEAAIEEAFQYDNTVLVEEFINGLEIELSVLENIDSVLEPLVSIPGEIAVRNSRYEFYSYEAKYDVNSNVQLIIPAPLTDQLIKQAQQIAKLAFTTLRCQGMARVDLFFNPQSERFYFNEVNTIPGFTSISMYPKLWAASGTEYTELLTRLVRLALARFERDMQINRDWS
jgi:D-alanine-D-alanine ligase